MIICYFLPQVQTGFGRLGSHFWGFESQGVIPDMGERHFLLIQFVASLAAYKMCL